MPGLSSSRTADIAELTTATGGELLSLVQKSPKIGIRLIESAAKQGITSAQLAFARMLLEGQGVPRNQRAAYDWFATAAEQGSAEARNMLGRCHEHGWGGVPADRTLAAKHYRLAARANFAKAQYNLGQLLLSGEPGTIQRREALGWHLVAAKSGYTKSMNVIGRACEEGWDMPRSVDNALGWYRRAADAGDDWGKAHLGRVLADEGDITEAVFWLRKAAAEGNAEFRDQLPGLLGERPEPELQAIGRALIERQRSGRKADRMEPSRAAVAKKRENTGWFSAFAPRT